MAKSIGVALRDNWGTLSNLPLGKSIFSRIIGVLVPYTGSIGACVDELKPGYGKVIMKDRRRVRNHLRSVHAIAMVNLGEMVTGVTLMYSLPDKTRGILVGIQMEYLKKARGTLIAECHCDIPKTNESQELKVSAEIKDAAGDVVSIATANWLIGPEESA